MHLKLVDWPLLVPGAKSIHETWANVQVMCIYPLISMKSVLLLFMLIKLDEIFIFFMSFAKIKSFRKISNFEGQNIGRFQVNLQIEPMCEAANYELRV